MRDHELVKAFYEAQTKATRAWKGYREVRTASLLAQAEEASAECEKAEKELLDYRIAHRNDFHA